VGTFVDLARSQAGLEGSDFFLHVALIRPKIRFGSVRHSVDIESGRLNIVHPVQKDVDLAVDRVCQMAKDDRVSGVCPVIES
jgi:hypothetical protein